MGRGIRNSSLICSSRSLNALLQELLSRMKLNTGATPLRNQQDTRGLVQQKSFANCFAWRGSSLSPNTASDSQIKSSLNYLSSSIEDSDYTDCVNSSDEISKKSRLDWGPPNKFAGQGLSHEAPNEQLVHLGGVGSVIATALDTSAYSITVKLSNRHS